MEPQGAFLCFPDEDNGLRGQVTSPGSLSQSEAELGP